MPLDLVRVGRVGVVGRILRRLPLPSPLGFLPGVAELKGMLQVSLLLRCGWASSAHTSPLRAEHFLRLEAEEKVRGGSTRKSARPVANCAGGGAHRGSTVGVLQELSDLSMAGSKDTVTSVLQP